MKYSLKEAFDNIKAEPELKDNTYEYLIKEISIRRQKTKTIRMPKLVYASIACLFLFFCGFKGYTIYLEPASFVSIDVNPSIELSLNKFDRVISYTGYSRESQKILEHVKIKNKSYSDAIEILMSNSMLDDYITNNSYISFTIQSYNTKKEETLLSGIESCTHTYLSSHHQNSNIEIEYSQIDSNLMEEAHSNGLSAGKYKAILELQEIEPDVTIEECRHKSLKELKTYMSDHDTQKETNGCTNMGNFKHHHH